jgi:hypothetical protein
MRYRCVDAQKAAGFPIAAACQAAEVSRAACYAWVARAGGSERQREEARLVGEIRCIHARSGGSYGVPRVHAELRRGGWMVNHKRVERLMRTHGIAGWRPRRRRSLTRPDASAAPAPDLLGRLFDRAGPRQCRDMHQMSERACCWIWLSARSIGGNAAVDVESCRLPPAPGDDRIADPVEPIACEC